MTDYIYDGGPIRLKYYNTYHHVIIAYNILYSNMLYRILAQEQLALPYNTGCPRRKGPNFGRVFLRSNYNDITQNTYIQSSMVTEILAREV